MNLKGHASNFTALRTRMDNDLKLLYLDKYTLLDENNKPMPHSTSITMNGPKTYSDKLLNALNEDERIFDIKSGSKPKIDGSVLRQIESDIQERYYRNDEDLARQLIESLESCLNFNILHRGWIADLALVYEDPKDSEKYQYSILPLDVRWMTWENGKRGFKQVTYQARMDRDEAFETYGQKFTQGKGKTVELTIGWDTKEYHIFEGNEAITPAKSIPHNLGIVPISIVPVYGQPMTLYSGVGGLISDYNNALSRRGESIYAANRDLYTKLNELVSIWASINKQQFLTPLAYVGLRKGFTERPFGHGIVVSLLPGEQLIEIPTKEMSATAQQLFGQIFADIQRGSVSNIDYSQIPGVMAASAIAQLQTHFNEKLNPRRRTKAALYRQTESILRYQLNHTCFKTKVDDEDAIIIDKTRYEQKYFINISFESVSPEENIVNYQLLNQAAPLRIMSRKKMLRDILHDPDPDQTLSDVDAEMAEDYSPELKIYKMAVAMDPGNLTDQEITKDQQAILFYALQKTFASENQPVSGPQMASQPKMNTNVGNQSLERLTKRMQDLSLNQASRKAQNTKNQGG